MEAQGKARGKPSDCFTTSHKKTQTPFLFGLLALFSHKKTSYNPCFLFPRSRLTLLKQRLTSFSLFAKLQQATRKYSLCTLRLPKRFVNHTLKVGRNLPISFIFSPLVLPSLPHLLAFFFSKFCQPLISFDQWLFIAKLAEAFTWPTVG